jgi:predicted RNase H-like nuclease (RuvC/YqgF family)
MIIPVLAVTVTPTFEVNVTVILSVVAISLSALATLTKIYGKRDQKPDELPGKTPYCEQHKADLMETKNTTKEINIKQENLKQIANDLKNEIGILKNQSENMIKTVDEMKQGNKELALKLDDLLKQLLDWMS